MARKITSIFNNREIKNVLSRCGIELLLNSYKFLYTNLIDNYVKEYLTDVHKALIDELKRTNSPVDIYCKFKEVIVDKEQMRKALKAWYKEKCMPDYSRQRIKELDEKFNLPCDTLKTIKSFRLMC